jgi:hypothetical protein
MNKRSRMFLHFNIIAAMLLCSISIIAQSNLNQLTKQWLRLDKSANQSWLQGKQQLVLEYNE